MEPVEVVGQTHRGPCQRRFRLAAQPELAASVGTNSRLTPVFGIRPLPYSTTIRVNGKTYA